MTDKAYKFPLVMRSTISGMLVMMDSAKDGNGQGKVISNGNGSKNSYRAYTIGERLDDWNMDVFIPFTPEITETK